MCPFSVTLQHVPDRELGPLLIQLAQAGFQNPIGRAVDARALRATRRLRLASRGRISPRIGGSCGSGRTSRISGRKGVSATRATACS